MSRHSLFLAREISLSAILLMLLTGCQSPTLSQIGAFGDSAASLATSATSGYEMIDGATITEQMYDVASDPSLSPKPDTFSGLLSTPPSAAANNIPVATSLPELTPDLQQSDALKARLALLQAVGKYASALKLLANTNYRQDIDTAAKNLDGALTSLNGEYSKVSGKPSSISANDIGIISTAVDAIGAVIVEEQRREAIKSVIVKAAPGIQEAAKLLEQEFGDTGPGRLPENVHQKLLAAAGSLEAAYNTEKTKPGSDFSKRYQMLIDMQNMYQLANGSPAFFSNISKGAGAMAKAHSALLSAVQNDKFTSADIAIDVGDLTSYAQSVDQFYKGLSTSTK